MSMISKQIDDLRAYAKDRKGELAKLVNDAANTIETLSAKLSAANMERSARYYHGGWIPCSERLPEDVEEGQEYPTVIYSTNSGEVAAGWYEVLTQTWWRESASDDVIKDKVIAWMPLPTPYTERLEE